MKTTYIVIRTCSNSVVKPEAIVCASYVEAKETLNSEFEKMLFEYSGKDEVQYAGNEDNGIGSVHAYVCVSGELGHDMTEYEWDIVEARNV